MVMRFCVAYVLMPGTIAKEINPLRQSQLRQFADWVAARELRDAANYFRWLCGDSGKSHPVLFVLCVCMRVRVCVQFYCKYALNL